MTAFRLQCAVVMNTTVVALGGFRATGRGLGRAPRLWRPSPVKIVGCPFRRSAKAMAKRMFGNLRSWPAVALCAASVVLSARAQAESSASQKAVAESLFDDGVRAMKVGHFADACPQLEESERIDSGIGTLLYLGECYEMIGRTASAWATFREAASTAQAHGETERARFGDSRADRLQAGLSKLTLRIAPETARLSSLRVTRDNASIASTLFGVAMPVDPGKYHIMASADGYDSYEADVDVAANADSKTVDIPALKGDPATAQALFDQAKKLIAAGETAKACPKFEESQRIDPALGTMLNLADCYERDGRTASAWSWFVEAEGRARAESHTDVATFARERSKKLAPRLSKLVVEAPPDAPRGMVIEHDDVIIRPSQWGVPIPADSGAHAIVAEAPGYERWERKVDLVGDAATLTVRVPPLEKEPVTPASAATLPTPVASARVQASAVATAASPATRTSTMRADSAPGAGGGLGGQRTAAVAAGTTGVTAAVVGTIFGLRSKSKHDEAFHGTCNDPNCTGEQAALTNARIAGNVSTAAFIVCAASLGAGAVLWITAGRTHVGSASRPEHGARARFGVSSGGVFLDGEW
jgi:tetratricopeptide (TPR) repeat protein